MGMLGVYMLTDENTMNILSDNDNLFEAVENYGEEKTTISYCIDKLLYGHHFLLNDKSSQ